MKPIDEILALEKEATQSEWEFKDESVYGTGEDNPLIEYGYELNNQNDAKLIVAMRNNIVALCGCAKALERVIQDPANAQYTARYALNKLKAE